MSRTKPTNRGVKAASRSTHVRKGRLSGDDRSEQVEEAIAPT